MQLSEIKKMRNDLANVIFLMINDFKKETGVDMVDIHVNYIKMETVGMEPSYQLNKVTVSLTI